MNPSYQKALDALLTGDRVNLSMLHQSDRHAIAQLFDYLICSDREVGGPDRIGDYLASKGVAEQTAGEIQDIYEAIYALRKGAPAWPEDFLKSL
jgi:hypothetical protein